MTPTDQFWNYFKPLCEAQPDGTPRGIVYVGLSDADRMDRLLADSRSEDCYPGIFVLRPKYGVKDANSGTIWGLFKVLFYVFVHAPQDDEAAQDAAYAQAEAIAGGIARDLNHAGKTYQVHFDLNSYLAEPVAYQVLDSVWGYEVKLEVGLPVNELFC